MNFTLNSYTPAKEDYLLKLLVFCNVSGLTSVNTPSSLIKIFFKTHKKSFSLI